MAVSAFKTKYTGEQIEKLFDKLANYTPDVPSVGEGQCYTTEISITNDDSVTGSLRNQTIETNFGTLSYSGSSKIAASYCSNISSLLSTDTTVGVKLNIPVILIYTFKKPVTLLRYRHANTHSMSGALYYEINNEWVSQGSVNVGVTELTPQTVEKVKVEFPSNSNCTLYYSIFDFMSDEYIISGPSIKDM